MTRSARRDAARRRQAHEAARQQDPDGLAGLTAQMGGLGYGQPSPDPAQLQAAAELRQTRWRIHEAEQALAAERALLAQQAPHLPQQSADPGWASGNTDTATPATDIITAADTAHTAVPSPNTPIDSPNGNGKKGSRLIKSSSSTVRPTSWVRRSGSGPSGIMAASPAIPSTASSTKCGSSSRPRSLIGSLSCSGVNMAWLTPPPGTQLAGPSL